MQAGESFVNEPCQNVCLENEFEYCFVVRKSRDRSRKINRWRENLTNSCKKEELLIINGRLGGNLGMEDFTCYSVFSTSLIDYTLCTLSPGPTPWTSGSSN